MEDIKKITDLEEIDEPEDIKEDEHNHGNITERNLSTEMKTSFLSYAMSVIVSRALPDARDGMKPVQRRILYGMNSLGITSDKAHKKSARIVGEVMGKYHPHGDSSIYDAMVRMAQPFSYREPLVDGHGNFGSIDGDGAAAMRYTEAKMSKIAMEMVKDIDKNTVDFKENYDSTETEPVVLPARFPNLLVNGSTGIAVGMATNIPPHNLGEVIDGVIAYMENKEISVSELMEYIPGPDFPTGGQILGLTGLRDAYETGNGKIITRAKTEIVNYKNKSTIIVTEIPYAVNKTTLIERIAEVAKDTKDRPRIIDGITDLRDESNLKGMRIVIELRKDVNPLVALNNLYKYTQLQSSFGINMIALIDNEPKKLSLKDALATYLDHQVEVTQRRTLFELEKAESRQHILEGLMVALNDIDRAIELIKQSKTTDDAKEALKTEYNLSDNQIKAILEMRLQRLTGLEIEKIKDEHQDLAIKIVDYKLIIESETRKFEIIKEELLAIKARYANPRLSEINLSDDLDIENEDLIPVEDIVVTVTKNGYIKRMKVDQYKTQNRGGIGVTGIKMHEDDYVEHMALTSTHDYHLFFTNKGRVYKMKGYKIPERSKTSKGIPIVNLINFDKDETLTSFTSIPDFDDENKFLFFVTKDGTVKRTPVSEYKNIRVNGIIALNLRDDDELISVKVTDGTKQILLAANNGKAILFKETDVRSMGRTATGVRGMNVPEKDFLIGANIMDNSDQEVLVVTEKGYGKRTALAEYRIQNRGGKGVKTLNVTAKNGQLVALRAVNADEDLIVSTDMGIAIRVAIQDISKIGRNTQGVRIIKLRADQSVATTAIVPHEDEESIEVIEKESGTQEALELNNQLNQKQPEEITLSPLEDEKEDNKTITKDSIFEEE
jgi:DNA gyrase subunit A